MLMLLTGTASALAQQIYGTSLPLTESSETAYYPNYFLSPPEGSWDAPSFLGQVDPDDNGAYMQCGAWCGDAYYGFLAKDGAVTKFVKTDWLTGLTTTLFTIDSGDGLANMKHLAYNYADKTLYGLTQEQNGEGKPISVLYKVAYTDEAGAAIKPAITLVEGQELGDSLLLGFEFDFEGNMYAVTRNEVTGDYGDPITVYALAFYGNDFKKDELKNITNYGNYVRDYGYGTYYIFSMEFDHNTGTLWYSRTDAGSQQYAYVLNMETGEQGNNRMFGNYPGWGAPSFDACNMYIPFTAPDGGTESANVVTGLTVSAEAGGAMVDTLKWTNPDINFMKKPLTELYSVRIYRDNVADENLVEELTGQEPGAPQQYVDQNAKQGMNKYLVVPCRVEGEKGLMSEIENWVGFDAPGAVPRIELTLEGGGIKVDWDEPAASAHGGPMNMASMTYNVVRMPDNIVVAEATTETSLIDLNPLPEWQSYSYDITPSTDMGKGETSNCWASIFAGPALTVPFSETFDNDQKNNMWKYVNALDNGFGGYFDTSLGMFYYMGIYWNADETNLKLDDWLFSPSINVEPGRYKVTVEGYSKKAGYDSEYSLYMGTRQSVEAQTTSLGTALNTSAADNEYKEFVYEFDVTEAGSYNFGVRSTGPRYNGNDLPDYADAERGISAFRIEAVEPPKPDTRDILVGDSLADAACVWNGLVPVDVYSQAESEIIYNADMLPLRKGDKITKVTFLGYNATGNVVTTNMKAYIGRTTQQRYDGAVTDRGTEYTPIFNEEKMVKVLDGNITIPQGGELDDNGKLKMNTAIDMFSLEMPEPFEYDGTGINFAFSHDLAVIEEGMNSKMGFLSIQEPIAWFEKTQSISMRSAWYDYYIACSYQPIIKLEVIPAETKDFSATGTVVDEEGNPVSDVKVVVFSGPDQFDALTDAEGAYTIAAKGVEEEMDIKAEKVGDANYIPVSGKFTLGESAEVSVSPLVLPFYRFTATGVVMSTEWEGLADVKITVTNPAGEVFTTTSSISGEFSLLVKGRDGKYGIMAEKEGYNLYEGEFEYNSEMVYNDMVSVDNILLENASGINTAAGDMNRDLKVYDLQGRYITTVKPSQKLNLQKGVYVIDGVKRVVK